MSEILRNKKDFSKEGIDYPKGEKFIIKEGNIFDKNDNFICKWHSYKSRLTFIGDDDGQWLERWKYIERIESLLQMHSEAEFYNVVARTNFLFTHWSQYGKTHNSPWIWTIEFYSAPLKDLKIMFDNLKGM